MEERPATLKTAVARRMRGSKAAKELPDPPLVGSLPAALATAQLLSNKRDIVEHLSRAFEDPASRLCVRYNTIRNVLRPVGAWDVVGHTANLAATVCGYKSPLEWVWPTEGGRRSLVVDGKVPRLNKAEAEAIGQLYEGMEAQYRLHCMSPYEDEPDDDGPVNERQLRKDFFDHVHFVRELFAQVGYAVMDDDDCKYVEMREILYNRVFHHLRRYRNKDIRKLKKDQRKLFATFRANYKENGCVYREDIVADDREPVQTRATRAGRAAVAAVAVAAAAAAASDSGDEGDGTVASVEFSSSSDEESEASEDEIEIDNRDRAMRRERLLEIAKRKREEREKTLAPRKKRRNGKSKGPNPSKAEAEAKKERDAAEKEMLFQQRCAVNGREAGKDAEVGDLKRDRPLLWDVLGSHRDLLRTTKRYKGSIPQGLLIEYPRLGEAVTGGSGPDAWKQDAAVLDSYEYVVMSNEGCYLFDQSQLAYHQETDLHEVVGSGFPCRAEIAEFAMEKGVRFHQIPGKGSHLDGRVKVAHSDSETYGKLSGDLQFDPGFVIDTMQELGADPNYNVHVCPLRGTTTWNFGYTSLAYDDDIPPQQRDTVAPAPTMSSVGKTSHPTLHPLLYEAMGPIADMLYDFQSEQVGGQYWDVDRHAKFGSKLRNLMKAKRSRFEAGTVAITELGDEGALKLDKRLLRHQDDKNDHREGYRYTCVWWIYVVHKGKVYRLVVIMYSRKSVGNCLDVEFRYMRPFQRHIHEYREQSVDYEKIHTIVVSDDEHYPPEMVKFGTADGFLAKHLEPNADPMLYYTLAVDAMQRFLEAYDKITYHRRVELFGTVMRSNCYALVYFIFTEWLPGGKYSLEGELDGSGNLRGRSLYRRFCILTEHIQVELSRVGPGNGKLLRFLESNGKARFGFDDGDEPDILESDNNLKAILRGANAGWTYKETMSRIGSDVAGVGHMRRLSFYAIGTCCGYLHSVNAIHESFYSSIGEGSAFADALLAAGCPRDSFHVVLKRIAQEEKTTQEITEHVGCKDSRKRGRFGRATVDCIPDSLHHFYRRDRVVDGWLNKCVFYRLPHGSEIWQPWVPTALEDDGIEQTLEWMEAGYYFSPSI